jgi:hypothetical protein
MISTKIAHTTIAAAYRCGPVKLNLGFEDSCLHDALHGLLSQYDAPWLFPETVIHVTIERGDALAGANEPIGAFFHSHHLRADRRGASLISVSNVGVWMEFDLVTGRAQIVVPFHSDWLVVVEDVEQQLIFLLARAWAQAGWTPLHAGSLIPPGETRCLLLCAPSGVGKTTLIASLLRRGWRTLGDDKTLLQKGKNGVVARSLAQRFHLHPSASCWFPEVGDINEWPRYSRWTEKRVVRIEEVWPDRLLDCAIPGGVVQLERIEGGLVVEPLDGINTLNTLLRQVAIPSDAEHARPLISCIGATAANLNSALIKIGNDAYADPASVDHLEKALRRLLP